MMRIMTKMRPLRPTGENDMEKCEKSAYKEPGCLRFKKMTKLRFVLELDKLIRKHGGTRYSVILFVVLIKMEPTSVFYITLR